MISSDTGVLKVLQDLRVLCPEFVLGGSAALHHLGFLERVPNDLDLIVRRHGGKLVNILEFPEFTVRVHEPMHIRDWKVDVMVVDPEWKISRYWDHWLGCNVQLPHQIQWVLEHVARTGLTKSPEKRVRDIEAMDAMRRNIYKSI